MRNRNNLCKPCCGCPVASDKFDREDQTIATSTFDTSGNWQCFNAAGKPSWKIEDGALVYPATGGSASNSLPLARCQIDGPYYWTVSVDVFLPVNSSAARLIMDSPDGTLRVSMRVESGGGSHPNTGNMSIINETSLLGGTGAFFPGAAWNVPIPGLASGLFHRLTLCYNPDTDILSCSVTEGTTGKTYWHHCNDVGLTGTYTISRFELWCDSTRTGDYQFENFAIGETKSSGGGYGYGYGEENNCPCCGPGGCSLVNAPLDSYENSQWSGGNFTGSTWNFNGSDLATTDSNARMIWMGSWAGRDDDCLPDPTTRVEATFQAGEFEDEIDILVDWLDATHYHYVRVTLASDADETTPGTVKLFDFSGEIKSVTVEGLLPDVSISVSVCYDGQVLAAICNGVLVETFAASHLGLRWGVGTSSISGTVSFTSVTASHNLYSTTCPDCESAATPSPCEMCEGNEISAAIKLRFFNLGGDVPESFCRFLNDTTWILKASLTGLCDDFSGPVTLGGCGSLSPGGEVNTSEFDPIMQADCMCGWGLNICPLASGTPPDLDWEAQDCSRESTEGPLFHIQMSVLLIKSGDNYWILGNLHFIVPGELGSPWSIWFLNLWKNTSGSIQCNPPDFVDLQLPAICGASDSLPGFSFPFCEPDDHDLSNIYMEVSAI